jgi:hypothetical protein
MKLTRAEKRKQIIEQLRDPLLAPNSNAAIARFHGVASETVARLRKEVEHDGEAFYKGSFHEINIADLRLDGGTQPRAKLDKSVIREYRDAIKAGTPFPPISVVYDGTDYWVWDGFHRVHAHKMVGREAIQAEVRQGTRRDALLLAAGANASHGLNRTNEDKQRAVRCLLSDPEWVKWSNEEIARRCGVSSHMVGCVRTSMVDKGEIDSDSIRVGADGRTIDTASIGTKQRERQETNGKPCEPRETPGAEQPEAVERSIPPQAWSASERERRERVEAGETVLANISEDALLIDWAKSRDLYVRIDRTSIWGNPFIVDEDGDRDEVCESYRRYLHDKPSLQRRFDELRGKVLGCWCYPERCHGNELIGLLDGSWSIDHAQYAQHRQRGRREGKPT